MPRKSELLSEETQTVNSPVRRSSRLSHTKEAAPADQAPAATVKTRRWSASDQEIGQNKSLRGRKGSQDVAEPQTPTKATRGRRSSVTSETADHEKPDAKISTANSLLSDSTETKGTPRKTRRRSASIDEGLMNENTRLTRSRRQSLEPLEVDVEAKRVTRSRRSSTENLEEPEIVHTPKKTTVTKAKRRNSVSLDPIEEQTENRRSVSPSQNTKDLSIILETSLKEEVNKSGIGSPGKIQTMSSKSPVLNDENKQHKQQTENRSVSPSQNTKEFSIIMETSLKEQVNKSGIGSPGNIQTMSSKSPVSNDETEKHKRQTENRKSVSPLQDVKDLSTILETSLKEKVKKSEIGSPGKIQTRSSKSPMLNDETEKRNTLSPRRSTRRSASKSPVVKEDGIITPKTRRSLSENYENRDHEKLKGNQNEEEHIADEANGIEPQNKTLIAKENSAEPNIDSKDQKQNNENEEDKDQVDLEVNQNGKVEYTDHENNGQIREENGQEKKLYDEKFASVESQTASASLSESKENDAQNIEMEDEDIKNQEEEKENVLARSNPDSFTLTEKILKLKEDSSEAPLQEMKVYNARVSLGGSHRVSNVFRPKDVDFSFAEPMEVDELSMLNDTRKTNIDISKLRDSSIDESVDESFRLTLSETVSDTNDINVKDERAGSKTEAEDVLRVKEPQNESTQKFRLSEDQKKLLSDTNGDVEDVGECRKTCESDDYEFEMPSDDDTDSNKQKSENTTRQKEEDHVQYISEQKQQMEGLGTNEVEVSSAFIGGEKTSTDAHLDHNQAKEVDEIHSKREEDENDAKEDAKKELNVDSLDEEKEIDNYHDKTTVIESLNHKVQSEDSQLNQTMKITQEISEDYIAIKEKPSKVEELGDTRVDDNEVIPDIYQEKSHKNEEIMNDGCLEGAKVDYSPKKSEDHGNIILDNAIEVSDNSNATLDLEKYTVDVNLTNPTSDKDQIENGKVTTNSDVKENLVIGSSDKSAATVANRKSEIASPKYDTCGRVVKISDSNSSSLSEKELGRPLESSKSNKSDAKEAVAAGKISTGSDVTESTPACHKNRRTRKLLQTVERNTTRDINQGDSVMIVEHSESTLTLSSKINKYLDSRIAQIVQLNSLSNDSVFLDDENESYEESMEENKGEIETSLADGSFIKEKKELVDSGDSEKQDTDESDFDNEHESSEENEFVNTMAEEGEEDTPSEDSNAIIDEGESVGSSDSEKEETDEYDSDDSFICNEEDEDLLPGYEFDLEIEDHKKKKSRIINVDDKNTDVIIMQTKKKTLKRGKVSSPESSSEEDTSDVEEVIVPQDGKDGKAEPTNSPKSETSARRSSITILENVNVKDIKDPGMSERIHSLMESFTTNIKEGDISLNLSLEYTNDNVLEKKVKKRKSDSSEADEADVKKTKFDEAEVDPPNEDKFLISAKKSKRQHKTSPHVDLKTKTFSLMNQLITDVKNRPRRSIKPSLTMESSWTVEKVKAMPSKTMISKQEIDEFNAKKSHPKDLRQNILYNSGRVKRIDTKTLLKKRGGI